MKKIILLFVLFSFLQNANATHNVGGEITLRQLDYKHYEVNLTTYYKASSIPADRDSLFLCWGDGICEWIPRVTEYEFGCSDIRYNLFQKTHQYAEEGTYTVSMTDPNRNSGILNINPPSSDNVAFHLQTVHRVSSDWNHTPILLNPPTDRGLLNRVFQHNAAAVDWDGDSLVYSLITPMQGVNEDVPNYSFPNEIGSSSNNEITIHPELGTLSWDSPKEPGLYTVAILIKEYRGNQLLSETIRDYQFGIYNNVDSNPPIETISINEVSVTVGDTLLVNSFGDDIDGNNILMQSLGLPFLVNNPALFDLDSMFFNPPLEGNFSWIITDAHELLEPYYVVFRLEDDTSEPCGITSYQVLKININDLPTSLNEIEKLAFKIFPNPVSNHWLQIKIPTDEIDQQSFYEVKNIYSQVIKTGKLKSSQTSQTVDLQLLANGSYFISIYGKDKMNTQLFIKQ